MGMPALQKHHWTAADVRALIQENQHWPRYELLDGELLVTPSPARAHQFAVTAMVILLGNYCRHEGIGVALVSPADLELAPETIMQPDVFVVPEELSDNDDGVRWQDITRLLLAVEVLSPSTLTQDRVRKRDFYLANGVPEYWIVDTDARVIERWAPAQATPDLRRDELVWHPRGGTQPLRLDVPEFFEKRVRLPRRV